MSTALLNTAVVSPFLPGPGSAIFPAASKKEQERARLQLHYLSQPYYPNLSTQAVGQYLDAAVAIEDDLTQELRPGLKLCDWIDSLIADEYSVEKLNEIKKLKQGSSYGSGNFYELRFLFMLALLKDRQNKILDYYHCSNKTGFEKFSSAYRLDPKLAKLLDDTGIDVLIQVPSWGRGYVYLPWQIKGSEASTTSSTLKLKSEDYEKARDVLGDSFHSYETRGAEDYVSFTRHVGESRVDNRTMLGLMKEFNPRNLSQKFNAYKALRLDRSIEEYSASEILVELFKQGIYEVQEGLMPSKSEIGQMKRSFAKLAEFDNYNELENSKLFSTFIKIFSALEDWHEILPDGSSVLDWIWRVLKPAALTVKEIPSVHFQEDPVFSRFNINNFYKNRIRLSLAYLVDKGVIEDFYSLGNYNMFKHREKRLPLVDEMHKDNLDYQNLGAEFLIKLKTDGEDCYIPLLTQSKKRTSENKTARITDDEAQALAAMDEDFAQLIRPSASADNKNYFSYKLQCPTLRALAKDSLTEFVFGIAQAIQDYQGETLSKEEAFDSNHARRTALMKAKGIIQLAA